MINAQQLNERLRKSMFKRENQQLVLIARQLGCEKLELKRFFLGHHSALAESKKLELDRLLRGGFNSENNQIKMKSSSKE